MTIQLSSFRRIAARRQGGGSVVAFIFGMVFGLLIAFGVAMYVSKSKTPFSGDVTQGAIANVKPEKGSSPPDPNSSLYGKSRQNTAAPAESAKANSGKEATTAAPASSTAAPAAVPGNQPVARTVYYLQVGSFRNREDAEQLRARLAFVGTESEIVVGDANGMEVNRVRVGPFESANAAYLARVPLTKGGFEATVVKD